jgi:hypothetical protein
MKLRYVLGLALAVSSCSTDDKGEACGLLDVYNTASGESYCPDENAPDDCEALFETFLDQAFACIEEGGAVVSDDDRDDVEAQLPDCGNAVATTLDYDECQDEIDEATCPGDGSLLPLPSVCRGVLIVNE